MSEVCQLYGLMASYPTKQACLEAGGQPVSQNTSDAQAPHEVLLPAYGPVRFEADPKWVETITEYDLAYKDLGSDNNRFVATREKLEDLATDLFRSAYLVKGVSEEGVGRWYAFLDVVNQTSGANGKISCYMNLSHPALPSVDREFLFGLIQSGEEITPAQAYGLYQRMPAYWQMDALQYNGWQGETYVSAGRAFFQALRSYLGVEQYEAMVGRIFQEELDHVLTLIDQAAVEQLLAMPEEEFLYNLDSVVLDHEKLPVGTGQKVSAYQVMMDFKAIALSRGISLDAYDFNRFVDSAAPGLAKEDYAQLYKFQSVALSIENTDNNQQRENFVNYFEHIAQDFLCAELNSDARLVLGNALSMLYHLGPYFGFSHSTLDVMLGYTADRLGRSLEVDGAVIDMFDLRQKAPITVGPQGLPNEVVNILAETGYYDLVRDNVREIHFTPEIIESKAMHGSDAGGLALSSTKAVLIDIVDPNGRPIEAWEIAAILVHEAAHVKWGRSVKKLALLQSTPDERQAFLTEAAFLDKYLRNEINSGWLDPGSNEALRLAADLAWSKLAGKAANHALGYAEDNFDTDFQGLPANDWLKDRGLSEAFDLELNVYPTDQAKMFIPDRFADLIDVLDLTAKEKQQTKQLFREIYGGEKYVTESSPAAEIRVMEKAFAAISSYVGETAPALEGRFSITPFELDDYLLSLMAAQDAVEYLSSF